MNIQIVSNEELYNKRKWLVEEVVSYPFDRYPDNYDKWLNYKKARRNICPRSTTAASAAEAAAASTNTDNNNDEYDIMLVDDL